MFVCLFVCSINRASSRHFSLCLSLLALIRSRCEVQRAETFLSRLDRRAEIYKHERLALFGETILQNHRELAVAEVHMRTVVPDVDEHVAQRAQRPVDELGLLQRLALRVRLVQPLAARQIHQIQPPIDHAVLGAVLSIDISTLYLAPPIPNSVNTTWLREDSSFMSVLCDSSLSPRLLPQRDTPTPPPSAGGCAAASARTASSRSSDTDGPPPTSHALCPRPHRTSPRSSDAAARRALADRVPPRGRSPRTTPPASIPSPHRANAPPPP